MLEYKITLTDEQQKILEHDLLDIKDWIDKAIDGKINNCLKRAANECRQILKTDPNALLPANDKLAALALFSSRHYKNRCQREAELVEKQQNTETRTVNTGDTTILEADPSNESK